MHHGLSAVSIDVITEYASGKSYDLLDQPDLGLQFFTLVHKIRPAAWVSRQWPWLKPFAMMVPEPIMKISSEPIGQVRDMQTVSHRIESLVVIFSSCTFSMPMNNLGKSGRAWKTQFLIRPRRIKYHYFLGSYDDIFRSANQGTNRQS